MKMNRIVILGFLCLAYSVSHSVFAESPGSVAIVNSARKSSSFLATKKESKDYRASEHGIQRQKQIVSKEVFLRTRLDVSKSNLPWAPNPPGD
jgi:hypothetical protein